VSKNLRGDVGVSG